MKHNYIIGIDPDTEKSGVAVIDRIQKSVRVDDEDKSIIYGQKDY